MPGQFLCDAAIHHLLPSLNPVLEYIWLPGPISFQHFRPLPSALLVKASINLVNLGNTKCRICSWDSVGSAQSYQKNALLISCFSLSTRSGISGYDFLTTACNGAINLSAKQIHSEIVISRPCRLHFGEFFFQRVWIPPLPAAWNNPPKPYVHMISLRVHLLHRLGTKNWQTPCARLE